MEFVQQYTPESKMFTVLYIDKLRFKQGIIEALVAVITKTTDLIALKEHPEMITRFHRLINSFVHENPNELDEKLISRIQKSKYRLQKDLLPDEFDD